MQFFTSALLTSVFALAALVAGAPLPTTAVVSVAVPTMDLGVPTPAPTMEEKQDLWGCQPIMGPDMVMM